MFSLDSEGRGYLKNSYYKHVSSGIQNKNYHKVVDRVHLRHGSAWTHLEQLNPAVLGILGLTLDLLLKVEDFPLHVPTDPFVVERGGRSSGHQVFSSAGKLVEAVPVLQPGIPDAL